MSRAASQRDVELLGCQCPLVLAKSARPDEFVLIGGLRTWHAALTVGQSASSPIRLRAFIIESARTGVEPLAAEFLVLDSGTRIVSPRGVIADAVCRGLDGDQGTPKRGTRSRVAARIGISRQAVWAAGRPTGHGSRHDALRGRHNRRRLRRSQPISREQRGPRP